MRLIDVDAYSKKVCTYNETGCGSCNVQTICPFDEPIVDAIPVRHGKWIKMDKDNTFFAPHMLKCSLCGNVLDRHGVNAGRGDANYCPNCGARMDEE